MPINPSPAIKTGLAPPGANPKIIPTTTIQALVTPGLNVLASPNAARQTGFAVTDLAFFPSQQAGRKEQILRPLSQGAFLIGP